MSKKGNEFKGIAAGVSYKRGAKLIGLTERFYRRAVGNKTFPTPIRAVDLGCGPGAMSYALAEKLVAGSELTGVDISDDQLNYARKYADQYHCTLKFLNCSMDELPFENNSLDLVISSMAVHETPPAVRRSTITEVARVLKPGGEFIYVDWSKPRFGLYGILWFPMLCFGQNREDNWNNNYPEICADNALVQIEDNYLNSVYRRQVFKKQNKE